MNPEIPSAPEAGEGSVIDDYPDLAKNLDTSFRLRGIEPEVNDIDMDRVARLVPGNAEIVRQSTGNVVDDYLNMTNIVSIARRTVKDYLNGVDTE